MGTGECGRRRKSLEQEDDDEEYKMEEEDEEEEEYGDEPSEREEGSEEEYDDTPRLVKRRKGKTDPSASRSQRRRYEDDDDYLDEPEEDEEVDEFQEDLEEEGEATPRPKCAKKCGGRSNKKAKLPPVADRSDRRRREEEDMDFDPDLDDEGGEEEDTDFDPELEGDEDEEFEEELRNRKVRVKSTVRRKPASKQRGRRKKNRASRRKVGRKAAPVRRPKIERYEEGTDDEVEVRRKPMRPLKIEHYEEDTEDEVEVRRKAVPVRRRKIEHYEEDTEGEVVVRRKAAHVRHRKIEHYEEDTEDEVEVRRKPAPVRRRKIEHYEEDTEGEVEVKRKAAPVRRRKIEHYEEDTEGQVVVRRKAAPVRRRKIEHYEEDTEGEVEVRRKAAPVRRRKIEHYEEDTENEVEVKAAPVRRRKIEHYEEDEVGVRRKAAPVRRPKIEHYEEDEVRVRRKAAPVRRRKIEHYEDDDFITEDEVEVNRRSRKKGRFQREAVPVAEADAWPTVDSDTSDFEFATSDEEPEDIEPVRVTVRKGRKKRASFSGSSSDSEFHVTDQELEDFREIESLNVERKKRTSVADSSSDSEFHVTDKELEDFRETEPLEVEKKKRKFISDSSSDSEFHASDKESGDSRKRKKRIVVSESSSGFGLHVSHEQGDLRETEPLEAEGKKRLIVSEPSPNSELGYFKETERPTSLRRISVTRNVEGKGKEKKEKEEAVRPRCGICLSEEQKMTLQGVLNCCSHYFCFACIMEWSRVESKCPLCKRRFETITKSSKVDLGLEPIKSVIKVEERDQVYEPTEEEIRRWLDPYENLVCIECNEGGDDSLMLLCDICDSSAHTYCVGLGSEVPEGNWYCGGCRVGGEGSSYPGSSVIRNSEYVGTTALNSTESSPSINAQQTFQVFDLNVSPREISRENHLAESQSSTVGVSTPPGGLATLSRRRGWIRTLLDRQRLISPDMGHNGVQQSGSVPRTGQNHRNSESTSEVNISETMERYARIFRARSESVPRTEPIRRNLLAPSEANTSQHSGSVSRTEPPNRRDTEASIAETMERCLRNWRARPESIPSIESIGRSFLAPSEATSQNLPDDPRNQHSGFLVQAQRNSSPCISVDGNNFQQNEGVNNNVKYMCSMSPH